MDADGRLIVRTDSGEEKVFTGEVSRPRHLWGRIGSSSIPAPLRPSGPGSAFFSFSPERVCGNPGFPTVFHITVFAGQRLWKTRAPKIPEGEALLPQARNAAENKFLASTFFSKKGSVTSFLPRFSLFSRFRIHRV
ncbi:MAG: hypothetical protein ACLVJH_01730 [Faecalibacterium prausnitzii]